MASAAARIPWGGFAFSALPREGVAKQAPLFRRAFISRASGFAA